ATAMSRLSQSLAAIITPPIGEIRPLLLVIAQLVRALLVIARAGVDEDRRARRLDDGAVKRKDHQTADWVHQPRSEPAAVPLDDLGGEFGMNYGWLEQRCLELEHAGDFDLTYAPAVNRAGGRRHHLYFLLSQGCSVLLTGSWGSRLRQFRHRRGKPCPESLVPAWPMRAPAGIQFYRQPELPRSGSCEPGSSLAG